MQKLIVFGFLAVLYSVWAMVLDYDIHHPPLPSTHLERTVP